MICILIHYPELLVLVRGDDPADARRQTEPEPATELAELIGEQVPAERQVDEDRAVEASGLIRQFGDFRAVDDVSFSMAPGEIFGLLGPNGAGKTTVIKMLTGLLPPTGGSGRVAGADIHGVPLHVKQRIGYMAQTFSLYPDLSVLENVALYANVYRVPWRELRQRCQWVLQLAGLTGMAHQRTNAVPMGARQRMALGCALVHRPQVVFLDEPTSGVDPVGRRQFWEILVRLLSRDHRHNAGDVTVQDVFVHHVTTSNSGATTDDHE